MGSTTSLGGTTNQRPSLVHGSYSRAAYHAGSWYSANRRELDSQLSTMLATAETETMSMGDSTTDNQGPLRGMICPHAGYSYSGPTAAFAYQHLAHEMARQDSPVETIVILHPSHHVHLNGCAVSGATQLETPLGNLTVDDALRREILELGSSAFDIMEQEVDEREHSGEMQYPYIAKALLLANKLDRVHVLPIMCGNISPSQEEYYGRLLAPILGRSDVLCVVSTDFCHWGSRFQYRPTAAEPTSNVEIHDFIRDMDHRGMRHIELEEPGAFAQYLKRTRNTICGRHAIGVWLNAVHTNNPSVETLDISFVKYAQSSQVRSFHESSVSYASATARRRG